MISLVDTQAWAAADLTGNSALLPAGDGDLFLVGGRRATGGHGVYLSRDYGATWSERAQILTPEGSMDPAATFDLDGNIHLILGVPNPNDPMSMDILKYRVTYDLGTMVFDVTGPMVLVEASKTVSAYDIATDVTTGTLLVVATAQEPKTPAGLSGRYALIAVEVNATTGARTHTVLEQSNWLTGNTCARGAIVSLGRSIY